MFSKYSTNFINNLGFEQISLNQNKTKSLWKATCISCSKINEIKYLAMRFFLVKKKNYLCLSCSVKQPDVVEKNRKKHLGKIGKDASNWQGGITKERILLTSRNEYKLLRKLVFERDDYTCQICLNRGIRLEMDHIKEWCNYPELRFEISNLRTLCQNCHKKTDNFGPKAKKKAA